MSSERIIGPSILMTNKLEVVGWLFERLWRVDEAAPFGRLLRRIDDGLLQHRSCTRIGRLHRMLERNYPG